MTELEFVASWFRAFALTQASELASPSTSSRLMSARFANSPVARMRNPVRASSSAR